MTYSKIYTYDKRAEEHVLICKENYANQMIEVEKAKLFFFDEQKGKTYRPSWVKRRIGERTISFLTGVLDLLLRIGVGLGFRKTEAFASSAW